MKRIVFVISILLATLNTSVSAQSLPEEPCRLSMVIPKHYVTAGKEASVATYLSKKSKTSLTMSRYHKDTLEEFMTAQIAAENSFDMLDDIETVTDLDISNETIGKTDFFIVTWIDHGRVKGFSTRMTAFNSDCELLYKFEMTSSTSSKNELDKEFRSFLRSCRLSRIN